MQGSAIKYAFELLVLAVYVFEATCRKDWQFFILDIQSDRSCLKATSQVIVHKPLEQHISHTDSLWDWKQTHNT